MLMAVTKIARKEILFRSNFSPVSFKAMTEVAKIKVQR